jgi:hypothetical protein
MEKFKNAYAPRCEGPTYRCPCCRYVTLSERGAYEICPVCFWEDDGQDDHDADDVRGGPNSSLSLNSARANFETFGACQARLVVHVRPPMQAELLGKRLSLEPAAKIE